MMLNNNNYNNKIENQECLEYLECLKCIENQVGLARLFLLVNQILLKKRLSLLKILIKKMLIIKI